MLRVDQIALERFRGESIARTGRNVSWQEIADKSGVTAAALRNIRNGNSGGSLGSISRLVDAFRGFGCTLSPEDLLSSQDRPQLR